MTYLAPIHRMPARRWDGDAAGVPGQTPLTEETPTFSDRDRFYTSKQAPLERLEGSLLGDCLALFGLIALFSGVAFIIIGVTWS